MNGAAKGARVAALAALTGLLLIAGCRGGSHAPPADADAQFSAALWEALTAAGLAGSGALRTHRYRGRPPHRGMVEQIDGLLRVAGRINPVLVLTEFDASGTARAWRIMYRRPGYSPAAADWFWASYSASGALLPAAEQNSGCANCHSVAPGADFVFSHNRYR